MRHAATALIAFATLAVTPALADAGKGEVRGFERLERKAPTPGEMVAAPSFGLPQIDGPGMGFTPDPRVTDDPAQPFDGAVSVQMGVADQLGYAPRSKRTGDLLGREDLYGGFDRSGSPYSYGYSAYYSPFAAYSPAWRDYAFARRVSPGDIAGLPSVGAPRSFWGFRD